MYKKYQNNSWHTQIVVSVGRNLEKVKCPQKEKEEEERGISWPSLLRGRQKKSINDQTLESILKQNFEKSWNYNFQYETVKRTHFLPWQLLSSCCCKKCQKFCQQKNREEGCKFLRGWERKRKIIRVTLLQKECDLLQMAALMHCRCVAARVGVIKN